MMCDVMNGSVVAMLGLCGVNEGEEMGTLGML